MQLGKQRLNMNSNIFKLTSVFCLLTFVSFAETELHFDVLKTSQGDYTNAIVKSATADSACVSYNGGMTSIKYTNLPSAVQKHFDYDPAKAAAAAEATRKMEIQRREAARKAAQEAEARKKLRAGPVQKVRVVELMTRFGSCKIETDSGIIKVHMYGLPKSIADYYDSVKALEGKIARQTLYAADLKIAAARAAANASPITYASGDYNFVTSTMNKAAADKAKADNMKVDADAAEDYLQKLKAQLANLQLDLNKSTSVNAYYTGEDYITVPVWQVKE